MVGGRRWLNHNVYQREDPRGECGEAFEDYDAESALEMRDS